MNIEKLAESDCPLPLDWKDQFNCDIYALTPSGAPSILKKHKNQNTTFHNNTIV
jgi:hypothetical protein